MLCAAPIPPVMKYRIIVLIWGEVAEWSKAAGCKPVSNTRVGSNPIFLIYMLISFKRLQSPKPYWLKYTNNFSLILKSTKVKKIKTLTSLLYFFNLVNVYTLKINSFFRFFVLLKYKPNQYLLSLNFKRLRFFPNLRTVKGQIFGSLSLGLLNKFFQKGKFFLKSKLVYLAVANFFRKLLIFSGLSAFFLHINRTPKYFLEILNTILEPVVSFYNNPFNTTKIINEQAWNPKFQFHSVIFTNTKAYGKVKVKQRGRLKRKIASRIFAVNKVLD